MIKIPQEGRWKSVHDGEKFGSLIRTKQINLSKDGVVSLAKKGMVLLSNDDAGITAFGNPHAIETDGNIAYIITDDANSQLFRIILTNDILILEAAQVSNSPNIGKWSDLALFNNTLLVSGDTNVKKLNDLGQGQLWTPSAVISGLDDTVPHPMCVNPKGNTILVGNGNKVNQYSAAYTFDASNSLTIPDEYIVTSIRYRLGRIYVGTRHRYGGNAMLFVWTGSGASATGYACGSDWIYSQADFNSSICILTSAGQILRFNGGGFDEVANLPVYHTAYSWSSDATNNSLIGKVASRGMRALGSVLYINIDGSLNVPSTAFPGKYLPEQPSGLWCVDPSAGLYHKAGYNYLSKLTLNITSIESQNFPLSTPHQAETGDPILFVGSVTGLTSGQVYYVIADSTTSLRLALSPKEALDGQNITGLTLAGTSYFRADRYESIGQTSITSAGGLMVLGKNYANPYYASEVMFGGSTIDAAQGAKGVLLSLGMGRNIGSFVTPKVAANKINDQYQKIVSFFENVYLPSDKIVMKFRKLKKNGLPTPLFFTGAANWTSTTTFTVDTTLKAFKAASVGDEVEVVEGAAGGYTAHITNIDSTSSLYVVTIDEIMPVSTGQFDFVVDNWTKIGDSVTTSLPNTLDAGYVEKTLGTTAKWVEFKVEMRGRGVMIEEMQSVNATNQ